MKGSVAAFYFYSVMKQHCRPVSWSTLKEKSSLGVFLLSVKYRFRSALQPQLPTGHTACVQACAIARIWVNFGTLVGMFSLFCTGLGFPLSDSLNDV